MELQIYQLKVTASASLNSMESMDVQFVLRLEKLSELDPEVHCNAIHIADNLKKEHLSDASNMRMQLDHVCLFLGLKVTPLFHDLCQIL